MDTEPGRWSDAVLSRLNLLSITLQLLARRGPLTPEQHHLLEVAHHEVERIEELLRQAERQPTDESSPPIE